MGLAGRPSHLFERKGPLSLSFDRLNSKRRAALPANAITLPYRFVPRSYQYSVLRYMDASRHEQPCATSGA